MIKLYNRICADCGRRFVSANKMAPRCPDCIENERVTIEQRDLRKSELGQIMRTEWRGRRIIGCNAVSHIRHNS